jgi:hypothetical protein
MNIKKWLSIGLITTSALVTGCGGGGDSSGTDTEAPIASASLSNLYGRLSLNYAVEGTTVFNSAVYSSSDLYAMDSGTVLLDYFETDASRGLVCSVLDDASGYLCAALTEEGETDYFLFQLDTNRVIRNGYHENCPAAQTSNGTDFDACLSDLVNTPDGSVTGSVSTVATGASVASGMASQRSAPAITPALAKALLKGLPARKR